MRRQTWQRFGMLLVALLAWSGVANAQHWLPVPTPKTGDFKPGSIALQLTDGTIMVQEYASSKWMKLTPDEHADYTTGTWSPLSPSTWTSASGARVVYAPRFFASAVLPDGRVIVEGGEYQYGNGPTNPPTAKRTNLGAIYDPVADCWTPINPPVTPATSTTPATTWPQIGDAPSIVLPDGTFMLGQLYTRQSALLDLTTFPPGKCNPPTPPSWKIVNPPTWTKASGKGKYDRNSEEGWTLLPGLNGNVLTVDTYTGTFPLTGSSAALPNNSEIFNPGSNPAKGTWTSAGNTIEPLSYLVCKGKKKTGEVGPAVLRPDGTVFATGVYECKPGLIGTSGHTAIYYPEGGFWKAGPDIPCNGAFYPPCNDMADAPAALLQDGNVLVQTSPGSATGNSTFYEFDLKTNTFLPSSIAAPPGFTQGNSESGRMLAAASGHVFYMRSGEPGEMWFYVPQGTYDPNWAPVITKVTDNGICLGCLNRGQTYVVSGAQLNGLSGGAAYGDDAQSASNYPLVLIEHCATGNKYFARTHDFSTMGVATGINVVTAQFTVTPNIPTGASSLIVIANGIPSLPFGAGCSNGGGGGFTVEPPLAGN
jgi:hypothetical protein